MEKPQDQVLNDKETEALRSILEMIIPYHINLDALNIPYLNRVSLSLNPEDRQGFIDYMVNEASHDGLVGVKMRLIYNKLNACYRRSPDVSPGKSGD